MHATFPARIGGEDGGQDGAVDGPVNRPPRQPKALQRLAEGSTTGARSTSVLWPVRSKWQFGQKAGFGLPDQPISAAQLKALQAVWGALCRVQKLGAAGTLRDARLAYVGAIVGRQIGSFKELTRAEANTAIERMNACLPEADRIKRKRRPDREQARRYGTAGRRSQKGSKEIELVDEQTWQILHGLMGELVWGRERLDAFVRSKHGPGRIDTLAQANRVIWSMRNMLRRKRRMVAAAEGKYQEATPF